MAEHPATQTILCIDPRRYGRNGKISNLINMAPHATQPILIVSDSDIGVPTDYVRRVLQALAGAGVGVVTCPYYGIAETGLWSKLAAMGLSYHFLPNVIAGVTMRDGGALHGLHDRASARRRSSGSAVSRLSPTCWRTITPSARRCGGWG